MKASDAGFPLVELMVTLAVAAILLTVGVPSFQQLIMSNRLTAAANDMVVAISVARSEAIKHNAAVNLNADCSVSFDGGTVRAAVVPPANVNLDSVQALIATPVGLLQVADPGAGYSGLGADINSTSITSGNHRCVYLATGSAISICRDSTACGGTTPNASWAN
ncbi:MAG: GspH/FimT family pseudopilin [Chromatiaceae bacterium]